MSKYFFNDWVNTNSELVKAFKTEFKYNCVKQIIIEKFENGFLYYKQICENGNIYFEKSKIENFDLNYIKNAKLANLIF